MSADPATLIVEAVLAAIGGLVQLDADSKRRARDAVDTQLVRFRAADHGALGPRLDAIAERERARIATHAAVLRAELAAGMMLPAPVHAAVVALADHAAPPPVSVGDAVREHVERTERSDEPTVELPLPVRT